MKITFNDYESKKKVTIDLMAGDAIEYKSVMYKVNKVADNMCRLVPVTDGRAMWIYYDRLFNTFPEPQKLIR
jgi:hypothetical protein